MGEERVPYTAFLRVEEKMSFQILRYLTEDHSSFGTREKEHFQKLRYPFGKTFKKRTCVKTGKASIGKG